MRFLIALVFLAACTLTAYPVDYTGPGAYCQPLSDYHQRCYDRLGRSWFCYVDGPGWKCYLERNRR